MGFAIKSLDELRVEGGSLRVSWAKFPQRSGSGSSSRFPSL